MPTLDDINTLPPSLDLSFDDLMAISDLADRRSPKRITVGQLYSLFEDVSEPRGQIWAQGQDVEFELTQTYVLLNLATTLDLATAIDFTQPSNGVLRYVGSKPKTFNVIGTTDVENTTGSSTEVSIKLAKGTAPIAATQCNATITNNGIGKLHTMWLINLQNGEEVSLYLAHATSSADVYPRRMRLQATPLV